MKAQGIRKTVFAAGMVVLGLNFTACVEYTSPLCAADKLQDIEGLEGSHSQYVVDQEFKMKMQTFEVDRVSEGTYYSGAIQTCRFGNSQIMQAKTEHGTYKVMAVNTAATGLSFAALVVGTEELTQAGVSYQIIERSSDQRIAGLPQSLSKSLSARSANGMKERVMLVDNSSPESIRALEKYAVPYSYGMILK